MANRVTKKSKGSGGGGVTVGDPVFNAVNPNLVLFGDENSDVQQSNQFYYNRANNILALSESLFNVDTFLFATPDNISFGDIDGAHNQDFIEYVGWQTGAAVLQMRNAVGQFFEVN